MTSAVNGGPINHRAYDGTFAVISPPQAAMCVPDIGTKDTSLLVNEKIRSRNGTFVASTLNVASQSTGGSEAGGGDFVIGRQHVRKTRPAADKIAFMRPVQFYI